jgi:hypothetical protein
MTVNEYSLGHIDSPCLLILPTPNPLTFSASIVGWYTDCSFESGHDPEKVIKNHIEVLHRYNEIKDGVQSLIGKVSPDRVYPSHPTVRPSLISPLICFSPCYHSFPIS